MSVRRMRGINVALLMLASGHAARPAQAGATRQLGCPAFGYTMRVPADWSVTGACSAKATATGHESPTASIVTVVVERHGRWSDDQARASIAGDARARGLSGSVFYQPLDLNDHRFLFGILDGVRQDETEVLFEEAQTFAGGRLYKIAFILPPPSTDRIATGTGTVGAILASIRIAARGTPPPAQGR